MKRCISSKNNIDEHRYQRFQVSRVPDPLQERNTFDHISPSNAFLWEKGNVSYTECQEKIFEEFVNL